jgi:Asp-tRNA(Asn)/Glu-tRNA(Gln) amidotransferase A subunit family amidase
MARTVEDMARLLDVLVGYDSEDTRTSVTEIAGDKSYLDPLDTNGLDNARIGVLRQAFNIDGDDEAAQVTSLVEDGLDSIINAGAELVDPVSIPDLDAKLEETWLYALQSRHDLDSFLSDLEDPPFGSFDELYESGMYYDEVGIIETMSDASSDPTTHLNYWQKVAAQDDLQRDILSLHAEHNLDAIVFPDIKVAPRPYERLQSDEDQEEYLTNTYIASQSSCPAVSMPGGFTDNGLPVGIELVGPPYSEQQLLSMASDYESVTNTRHQASTAPKL